METQTRPFGHLLRTWRQRRRVSQLDLALDAGVSARHISFVETGRSLPSREMVLHLAGHLDVPLRERNDLLVAAGYAPVFPETSLDDPAGEAARRAIEIVLTGHEPYPAIAIDRYWNLVSANRAIGILLEGIAPELLQPPVNVLRASLHPDGLVSRAVDRVGWREHLLNLVRRTIDRTADPGLIELLDELQSYPATTPDDARATSSEFPETGGLIIPMRLRTRFGELSFFSTTTIFGTARDVTLAELAIESFFPADAETGDALREIARAG